MDFWFYDGGVTLVCMESFDWQEGVFEFGSSQEGKNFSQEITP